jgi:hypothetical protein
VCRTGRKCLLAPFLRCFGVDAWRYWNSARSLLYVKMCKPSMTILWVLIRKLCRLPFGKFDVLITWFRLEWGES